MMYSWHEEQHTFVDVTVFQFPFYYVWGFIWVTRSLADMISSILLLKVGEKFLSSGFCLRFALVFNSYYFGRLASPEDEDILDQVKGMLSSLLIIISPFFLSNVCRHYLINKQVKR